MPNCSVGDHLRAIRDRPEQSACAEDTKPYWARGETLLTGLSVNVVKEKLGRIVGGGDGDSGPGMGMCKAIIDGFPRNTDQGAAFEREVWDLVTVGLKCSKGLAGKRLLGRGGTETIGSCLRVGMRS
jgi:adenylate kinase family enzyme